jgi:hypothetical protein
MQYPTSLHDYGIRLRRNVLVRFDYSYKDGFQHNFL